MHDTNRDALARRVAVVRELAPNAEVIGFASRVSLRLRCRRDAPTPVLALIDLCDTDRLTIDRPGERLIRRLAGDPTLAHVVPVAWSAHAVPDAIDAVRAAGGAGFVAADPDPAVERVGLTHALAGAPPWPVLPADDASVDAEWREHFAQRFRTRWEPWMEPVLSRLATSEPRTTVAAMLVETQGARSEKQAQERTRRLARLLAGENATHAGEVARRAAIVLAELAGRRPLAERPALPVSLAQGAALLRDSPTLGVAAGITGAEADDILRLDELVAEQRESEGGRPAGAPPADLAVQERRYAAGRRALEHGAGADSHGLVVAGILRRVDEALREVDDCRNEDLFHPEARAAVALAMLEQRPVQTPLPAVDHLDRDGDRVLYAGLSADELALDATLPPSALQRLVDAVDGLLSPSGDGR